MIEQIEKMKDILLSEDRIVTFKRLLSMILKEKLMVVNMEDKIRNLTKEEDKLFLKGKIENKEGEKETIGIFLSPMEDAKQYAFSYWIYFFEKILLHTELKQEFEKISLQQLEVQVKAIEKHHDMLTIQTNKEESALTLGIEAHFLELSEYLKTKQLVNKKLALSKKEIEFFKKKLFIVIKEQKIKF